MENCSRSDSNCSDRHHFSATIVQLLQRRLTFSVPVSDVGDIEVDWFTSCSVWGHLWSQSAPWVHLACGELGPKSFSALHAPLDPGYWSLPTGLSRIKSPCSPPARWRKSSWRKSCTRLLTAPLCVHVFSFHLVSLLLVQIVSACASPGSTRSSIISPRCWILL